ncbi:MAG: ABC transporter permease subunit [Campylobacterota bacterium]|nr:ABC transporter permease subunit [Campylobacterota bacterium]
MKKLLYWLLSLTLFFILWEIGYRTFGDLVLPPVLDTFSMFFTLLQEPEVLQNMGITMKRIFFGLGASILVASLLGVVAGLIKPISYMIAPIVTIMLGMPSIAWIVLAMIWFGMGDPTVIFVVFVATFPIIFLGSFAGMQSIDKDLLIMADSFELCLKTRLLNIYFPHIFSFIFPAWLTAIGLSWKIVMMAELISSDDGMGSLLAVARSHIDTTSVMALLMLMVSMLIVFERLFLDPMKQRLESWRK